MAEITNEWENTAGSGDGHEGIFEKLTKYTPSGHSIPEDTWRGRHRNIVLLLLAHIPFLFALGLYEGTESISGATFPAYSLPEIFLRLGVLFGFALLASWPRLGRRVRTSLATIGLATGSAVLVYFSGGLIEAHFHFFVVMGVVAVYEDWLPFLVGIVYVAIQHGYFGMTAPEAVYNHTAAIANPFVWAFIHAAFVLALAAALMTNWYSIERSREQARQRLAETEAAEEAKAEVEAKQREVERLNEHLEAKADAYSATMARAADGDLGARLDAESESEAMVQIAEGYNEMMDEMETAVQDIQAFAQEVTAASEEAYVGAEEVKQASADVSESVQTISEGTDEQREMLEEVYAEMTDLSATVQEVASSAEGVAETSHETATIADAGEETARQAIDDAQGAQSSIDSTVEHVERLERQMAEIGEIVELISDIAEQTNMLALNANIEAARFSGGSGSGNGDGFAVVADEVKQLAEETQESANDIEQLIEETQAQTERTVTEARAADQQMQEGVEAVQDVLDAFSQVATNTEETDSGIQEISEATDDQAVSAEEAVAMVEEVSEISQTTAEESADVSAAAEEQASSITQVSANVESLTEQAEQLQALLAKFEVSAAPSPAESPSATSPAGSDVALGDGGR
ncbi:methyl-accepting chemotaxis protein [Halobellus sp. Atlit-38R]|jgi:methyl-accepting chemotaxis protein|uniref:methyl-accepting chemotaxis protein n=1 Tax=Halobellus sp. Atlit-38R TaxID=2282131 RepID=UPI000EF28454|nr:methyl-accepting chemotaxis protein [Halobellus sp. Atlit-38R]RLM88358.1 methyl-accepting chemotaxis protein [Halobellus sp. Atlit-38R]